MTATKTPSLARRQIGQSGLYVTELGLGCAAMTGNLGPVADEEIAGAIHEALMHDVRYIDTAPLYGFGRSERFVGDALRRHGGDCVLSTKVGRLLRPGVADEADARFWFDAFPFKPVFDYTYDGVMRSYEDSLQRLGLSSVDILLLHDIGEMQHGRAANQSHFRDAMTGGYKALDELRRSGDVKCIGLGVNEREVCLAALERGDWDCFLLAGRYTLLEQSPLDDLLPACERANTSLIIGGPFNSGILAGGTTWNCEPAPTPVIEKVKRIAEVCDSHNVPLAAAALRFPLGASVVASVIPGPRSAAEARSILAWFKWDVPSSLWSDLRGEGLLHPDAPTP